MRIRVAISFIFFVWVNITNYSSFAQSSTDSTRFGFKAINDSLRLDQESNYFDVYTYNYTREKKSGFLAYFNPYMETILYGDKDSAEHKNGIWIKCKPTKRFLDKEQIKLNPEEYLKKQEIQEIYFYHNDTLLFSFSSNFNDNKSKSSVSDLTFGTWKGNYDPLKIKSVFFEVSTDTKDRLDHLRIVLDTYYNLQIVVSLRFKKSRVILATGHSVLVKP